MAWTATFLANFEQFDAALRAADVKLGAFDQNANKVRRSLQQMTSEFDGTKVTQQATTMAAAIEKAGGAAKLTEAELKRANATLQEAVEKYQKLGQVAPASLQGMADAVKAQLPHLDQVTQKTSTWGTALGSVKGIAAGMIAGFTLDRVITGIGGAISSTIAFGDEISDLSDKTGVSTTALQRWNFAAKQTGTDLQTLVNAAQELSKRLGEGDKSTVAAVEALGLSFQGLRGQSPEQQLETIAEALQGVTNQGEQASIGADLFGRSWKEVIAPVRVGLKELGDEAERLGVVIDEQTIKATGQLADTWQKLKDSGTGLLANVLAPMVPLLKDLADGMIRLAQTKAPSWWQFGGMGAGAALGPAGIVGGLAFAGATAGKTPTGGGKSAPLPGSVMVPFVGTSEEFQGLQRTLGIVDGVFMKDLLPATKKTADAFEGLVQGVRLLDLSIGDLDRFFSTTSRNLSVSFGGGFTAATGGFLGPGGFSPAGNLGGGGNPQNPYAGIFGSGGNFATLTAPWDMSGMGGGINYGSVPGTTMAAPLGRSTLNWRGAGAAGLGAAMPWLSQLVAGGSRSGQVGGAIGGSVGGGLGSLFSGAMGLMGSIVPFLGPVLGLVGGLVGKLFGPSRGAVLGKEADQRIGQTQAQLLQQYGSVEAIAGMGSAGEALAAAWGSKNVQGEAHFNELVQAFQKQNQLLSEQKDLESQIADQEARRQALVDSLIPSAEQLRSITEKYGINVEGLGTAFNQIGATANWTSMLNDIEKLNAASADVGGYLTGMKDEIGALVAESLKLGTTIPENMKPFIQNLFDTGQLLDANGKKITDISQLKWGAPVETEGDKAREAIAEIDKVMGDLKQTLLDVVEALKTGLPGAARDAAAGIANTTFPTIKIPVEIDQPDLPSYASGSGGLRDFGSGTLAVLHGREAVVTESQYRAGSGGITITAAPIILDGRVIGQVVFEQLPQQLRRAGLRV